MLKINSFIYSYTIIPCIRSGFKCVVYSKSQNVIYTTPYNMISRDTIKLISNYINVEVIINDSTTPTHHIESTISLTYKENISLIVVAFFQSNACQETEKYYSENEHCTYEKRGKRSLTILVTFIREGNIDYTH